jgi:hypothetical protein
MDSREKKMIPKTVFYMALTFWLFPWFYYFIRFKHNISLEGDKLWQFWTFFLFWLSAFIFSLAALIVDRKMRGLGLWQKLVSWFVIAVFLLVLILYFVIP